MVNLSVESYAKVNWTLKVLGRRPDGFHEVETFLETISLRDELHFQPASRDVTLTAEGREVVTGGQNLILRAAQLLKSDTGTEAGARIILKKTIPIGAGLGGGSSNAAATLVALDRLWQTSVGLGRLTELASRLGSDVPFFLKGGLAFACGRGERVEWIGECSRSRRLILFFPGFEISAAEAYRLWDEDHRDQSHWLTETRSGTNIRPRRVPVADEDWQDRLENDLEGGVLSAFPRLAFLREKISATGCRTVLCGSGSSLLAVGTGGQMTEAYEALSDEEGEVFSCHTVGRGSRLIP